jgi:hypothetical protein
MVLQEKTMAADVSVKKEATVNNPCCKVVSYCFVGFDIIVWFFFSGFFGFLMINVLWVFF